MKQTTVAFNGTLEQEAKLHELTKKYKDTKGALMPVLQQAQDIYGYLPYEVQKIVAEDMNISLEEIYGVVSFYTQFSLNPKGKYKISVCMGTACYVKRAAEIVERVKTKLKIDDGECTEDGVFSFDATRCLGCCGLAPVMTINDDVYGKIEPTDVDKILESYNGVSK